jgi:GT2 family glycosyltransferase
MDDDIKAEPNCLAEIARSFEDESIAAMTGLVLAAELETEAQYLFEKEWTFNRGFTDKIYDNNFFIKTLQGGPPVWEIGAGANMAFRKSVLEKTGYFDERLDVGAAGCNGDSEIWFRILAKGFSIAYNPRAVVHHEHRKNMEGLQKQLYNYMKGFTVAALIQQKQQKNAGYYRHLFSVLPPWYLKLIIKGFPGYASRYSTVFAEIRGIFAGLIYFIKHRKRSPVNIH